MVVEKDSNTRGPLWTEKGVMCAEDTRQILCDLDSSLEPDFFFQLSVQFSTQSVLAVSYQTTAANVRAFKIDFIFDEGSRPQGWKCI